MLEILSEAGGTEVSEAEVPGLIKLVFHGRRHFKK